MPVFKSSDDLKLLVLFDELKHFGLKREARLILSRLATNAKNEPRVMLWLAQQAKAVDDKRVMSTNTVRYIANTEPEHWQHAWEDIFPRVEETLIKRFLLKYNSPLSYEFVASLIRQESVFDPFATSSAKAQGLMQLMPSTAKDVGKGIGKEKHNLYRVEDNIELGIALLTKLHQKYLGRLDYVLSAYNAGEKITDQWVARRGELDQITFIEAIPYSETRNYIKLIFRNLCFYEWLDEKKILTLSDRRGELL
jgi:hypothetical protein